MPETRVDFGAISRVSLIVPMFNEEDHVEALVGDIAKQDFVGELETIVADGRSTDRSVDRLRAAAKEAGVAVTVLTNDARWVSSGLNECIRRARGDLVVRLDCHTRYPSNYVSLSVLAAEETQAWCVGGTVEAVGRTPTERAVACAMSSPFGGISWSRHSGGTGRVEVDTVFAGAFRPQVFADVGFYDERLVRNQDDELSLRLRRAGGRIVLDPAIRASYTPRGSYGAVLRQYYEYGLWKIPVMIKHRQVVSLRSLAPPALVGSLAVLVAGSTRSGLARRLLAAEIAVYAIAATTFAHNTVRGRAEESRLAPRVALAFASFHTGYGVGFCRGAIEAARRHFNHRLSARKH